MNRRQTIRKLNADEYVDLNTGDIREFNKADNRSEGYSSLTKTFKRLRYLINNNFTGADNELFLTLTYAENMTDTERLYKDMDRFIKRFRYRYRDKGTIDYINVVEPQGRGAWHCHILLRFNDVDRIFIPWQDIVKIWTFGTIDIRKIDNVDNVGAYLTAYLADIPLEEYEGTESRAVLVKEGKKYVKGGRLHMYPVGMNIYRKSKGIQMPERKRMKYKNAKKKIGIAVPTYLKSYEIRDSDDKFINSISYEQYNIKRVTNKV